MSTYVGIFFALLLAGVIICGVNLTANRTPPPRRGRRRNDGGYDPCYAPSHDSYSDSGGGGDCGDGGGGDGGGGGGGGGGGD